MPRAETVAIPLSGVHVGDAATGTAVDLGELRGVQIVVLMRHRH